jgi:hypothetical protein
MLRKKDVAIRSTNEMLREAIAIVSPYDGKECSKLLKEIMSRPEYYLAKSPDNAMAYLMLELLIESGDRLGFLPTRLPYGSFDKYEFVEESPIFIIASDDGEIIFKYAPPLHCDFVVDAGT